MDPLRLTVSWYRIHHAGEQATHWDIQNKKIQIWLDEVTGWSEVLDVPVLNLLSSMADSVPCDR